MAETWWLVCGPPRAPFTAQPQRRVDAPESARPTAQTFTIWPFPENLC